MLTCALHAFCAEAFYQSLLNTMILQGKNLSETYQQHGLSGLGNKKTSTGF